MKESDLKPLSLNTFYTPFMIYAGFLKFATLSFFKELCSAKKPQQPKKSQRTEDPKSTPQSSTVA